MLILGSILVLIGIKMVPKVNQRATKMHQKTRTEKNTNKTKTLSTFWATWSIWDAVLAATGF